GVVIPTAHSYAKPMGELYGHRSHLGQSTCHRNLCRWINTDHTIQSDQAGARSGTRPWAFPNHQTMVRKPQRPFQTFAVHYHLRLRNTIAGHAGTARMVRGTERRSRCGQLARRNDETNTTA